MLYWLLRHAPSAMFPVVHEHNRCFNRFIVLRFPLTHALLCERVCTSHCYSATIATQPYCTAVSFLNILRSDQLRLAAPTCCRTKTVQEGDQLLEFLDRGRTFVTRFLPWNSYDSRVLRTKVVCSYCQTYSCLI